jgi:hypothetical protein
MDDITVKQQNLAAWQCGAFGNKLRAWRTIEGWRASGFGGLVAIRSLVPGGPCFVDLAPDVLLSRFDELVQNGHRPDQLMINESAPNSRAILQGEYDNELWGCFRYSVSPCPMREALRNSRETYGLRSRLILRWAMSPSSYEDFLVLLDRYPKHVLEVSVYDCCVGDTPGRNALVWEVRRY